MLELQCSSEELVEHFTFLPTNVVCLTPPLSSLNTSTMFSLIQRTLPQYPNIALEGKETRQIVQ